MAWLVADSLRVPQAGVCCETPCRDVPGHSHQVRKHPVGVYNGTGIDLLLVLQAADLTEFSYPQCSNYGRIVSQSVSALEDQFPEDFACISPIHANICLNQK
jgi:hypothetical protein